MKARFIILWCLVAVLLCSCAAGSPTISAASPTIPDGPPIINDNYAIYIRDGKAYLEFSSTVPTRPLAVNGILSVATPYPQFTSISDMYQKITSGDIPVKQLARLRDIKNSDILEICHPNYLYDLALPDNLSYSVITWHGNYYDFSLKNGYVLVDEPAEYYNYHFEKEYVNFLVPDTDEVLSDTVVQDRNARVVNYLRSDIGEFKDVFYTVTTPRGSILVRENYVVEYYGGYGGNYEASETVPKSVWLFGTEGESHFYARFMGLSYRPSVEWISSFGLVPYKAQNAS